MLLFLSSLILLSGQPSSLLPGSHKAIEEAEDLRFQQPDSSVLLLQTFYEQAMAATDTISAIKSLMALTSVFGHRANYKESYDQLWKALLLADAADLKLEQANIYKAIGRYYSFYHREEKALKYLQLSLNIKKTLVQEDSLEHAHLVDTYLAICATYRGLDDPEQGKIFLDSALQYYSPEHQGQWEFIKMEEAKLLHQEGFHTDALALFEGLLPWFKEHKPSYLVIYYYYMGSTHQALNNFSSSERYYKEALHISDTYNSHIDFSPLVHEKLAELHKLQGNFQQAYKSLKTTKDLDVAFFDSRSERNLSLLEIQDAFRKEKESQLLFQQQQRLSQFEQEETVLFLQRVLLIGFIAFLLFTGLLAFNYVKAKHRAEKQLIQRSTELEIQKTNELVELKNRELAASALKLIEKEVLISNLKDRLSKGNGDIKRQEIKQIVRSISNSNKAHWREFETRFVSVNRSFYDRLGYRFPKLTERDKKLCALVKLNFSSKEMAKLLGISIESVHTTRYRLRKKLNLARSVNLTEFIASV